jgi:hypothetical protein
MHMSFGPRYVAMARDRTLALISHVKLFCFPLKAHASAILAVSLVLGKGWARLAHRSCSFSGLALHAGDTAPFQVSVR